MPETLERLVFQHFESLGFETENTVQSPAVSSSKLGFNNLAKTTNI